MPSGRWFRAGWASLAGLAIGTMEWSFGQAPDNVRAVVWILSAFAVLSMVAALGAVAASRMWKRLDPVWLWLWLWIGYYATLQANIWILPRQSLLTLPSIALTAGALVAAGIVAGIVAGIAAGIITRLVARAVQRGIGSRLARAGWVAASMSAAAVICIPAMTPRNDLAGQHQPRKNGQLSAVVIVVDTMRADHLSCYGYSRATTPSIDALAARGTRFDSAWSSSSWTVPAVASLFSGLPLSQHRTGSTAARFDVEPTLAGVLAQGGLVTAGFSSNYLVSPMFGLDGGFGLFVSYRTGLVNPWVDATSGTTLSRLVRRWTDGDRMVVHQAKQWLTAHREDRFFLYVHLFAPHRPYAPPEPYRSRFVDSGYRGVEYEGAANGEMLEPSQLDNALQRYDAEIAYADDLVGKLVGHLEALGLDESTAIIVTSDHGEAFGEHGYWEHGQGLNVEETRIPLVARLPGESRSVITEPVSITDLYATLLELLGVKSTVVPETSVSLVRSLVDGSAPPAHPVVAEILGNEGTVHPETLEAVTLGEARLIRNITRGTDSLYDVSKDAAEIHPVNNPELGRLLQGYLAPSWWMEQGAVTAGKSRLTEEDLEQLRSLGYVR